MCKLIEIYILICSLFFYGVEMDNQTLQLVHVLFRHGDRTLDATSNYPKDPHRNETYHPYGFGELTNKGKQTEYKLGKALRQQYNDFLGDLYTPDILEAQSSSFNRTKMSLQLVLTGLFPPVGEQIWQSGLNWQPIPFSTLPIETDKLFLTFASCPDFVKHLWKVADSPPMQKEYKKYRNTFAYVSHHTGEKIENYMDMADIYSTLVCEDEWGLPLPDWTKPIYPDLLKNFSAAAFAIVTSTTELRRIGAGHLLQKIIDDSKAKAKGESVIKKRKIFLYSGHDLNVCFLLSTLELFEPHLPPYGAYVLLELHKIDGVDGFKVFYQDYSSGDPKLLKLPACEEFCPLDKFISLTEKYMPREDTCIKKTEDNKQ